MSQPPQLAARPLGWLLLLGALTALGPVSIDLYLPAFSVIEADLGQGIESTLAAYMFGVAIGQLFYGPISDRFGRKPPLYVALSLYALGSLGCALADSMTALVLCRLLQALGGCAGVVIARAVVRDSCEAHEAARVFSTLILITAVGPIVSPLLGSFIAAAGSWRTLFYLQAAAGLLMLLIMHFSLQETGRRGAALSFRRVAATYADLLRDRTFIGHALVGACVIGVIFCYISSAPTVLMMSYGLSPQQLALLMGLNGLSFVVASQLNLYRLRAHTPAAILSVAVWVPVVFAAATLLTNLHSPTYLWLLVLLQVGIFAGTGHISPNATAEALAHQGNRAGAASALLGSIQSVGSTLAGLAMAVFSKGGVHSMAILMLVGSVAMLAAHYWLARPRPNT
ncbi:MAG: multidrug effflux MFS transporter [Steroidobacteraceae bacterium]